MKFHTVIIVGRLPIRPDEIVMNLTGFIAIIEDTFKVKGKTCYFEYLCLFEA